TDLFNATTIGRMLGHFQQLLRAALRAPERPLSELEMMSEAEREEVLRRWSGAATPAATFEGIPALFERQAASTPEAVALLFGDERVSYAQLNARANQLARHLGALGVGPEVMVGLCVERSVEMVVSLVAVLKAGGAYVPLDPQYPRERLAFMLEDSGAKVLVTQRHLVASLPEHPASVFVLDEQRGDLDSYPSEDLGVDVDPSSLAYVIYTSGSTGRPKGVAVPHRGVARLVLQTDYAQLCASDRVAQASNSSFDAATFEVWGALLNGARLVLVEREVALAPERFAAELRERGVTALFLTTALFNQVARSAPDAFAPLRHVLFGGEAVDPRWVREVLRAGGPGRLLHVYGPTENTTFSTWHEVREVAEGAATVPIGRPVANTQVYVLDAGLRPVPEGVAGELYLGGAGLARGYLKRAALTAERFVPDAYSGEAGARLYRTGDVVRWRAGGQIEFVGRLDGQVKVRGFRVELGEVEAALLAHTRVSECVVVAREDAGGEGRRLVAYVVGRGGEGLSEEVRRYVAGRLPGYMVPSAVVELERLPLTPNGKIDKRALPEPARPDVAAYAAPRNGLEELVAGVWADLLGLERVGVNDNFFELGGHSLLATQAVSRLREACGVEISLRALFEHPTVEGLTGIVEQSLRGEGEQATVMPPLVRVSREGELPLSFAQQRLWFLDQLEPNSSFYNLPIAMRLEGELDVEALELTLSEIVRRHEVLRTTFPNLEGHPAQLISPAYRVRLETEDLSSLPEGERREAARRLTAEEAQKPFDLSAGPLVRVRLLRLSDEEHVALLTMHHIVSDGWSMSVLVAEVGQLYAAFA
ncbi:MAG TPA: amino acid adenylation domain-containing protein, partial [Pyrinomonadaceae bacterium]|nr:amino acid adenylation domain-containing protein [Pyrinomonadaceae bacterium]